MTNLGWDNGFDLMSTNQPLHKVADFEGLKMRKLGIQERAFWRGATGLNSRHRDSARSIDALEVFMNDRLLRSIESKLLLATP